MRLQRGNRLAWVAATLVAIGAASSGCTTDAYCFDCADNAGPDAAGDTNVPDTNNQDVIIFQETGTGDAADGGDAQQNCEADTLTSPSNCGACGHVCNLPGAIPKCVNGQCLIDSCAPGRYDLNHDPSDGCEYQCPTNPPTAEVCNGKDDDCDGVVDNGFDLQTDVNNCGSCGHVCEAVNADNTCVAGQCVYTCHDGYSDLGDASGNGCFYQCPVNPPTAEVCNGIDDDCNGIKDDGSPGAGQPCETNCPNGQCLGECKPGETVCTGTAAGLICIGGIGPTGELCDGKDNDCDGVIDNGFDLQTDPMNCGACNVQCQGADKCVAGKCQFSCQPGYVDLDGNPGNGCEYKCPVFPPVAETCNGLDDDCNGLVDDNPTDVGVACSDSCPAPAACVASGNCSPYQISTNTNGCYGACQASVTACVGGHIACSHPSYTPDEICDGIDNNCDGRIDEGFDLKSDPTNCGACGHQCSAPNAQVVACVNGACSVVVSCANGYADIDKDPANGCEYKCPTYPPVSETCNGVDDDCNGIVDDNPTDVGMACTTNCPTPNSCVSSGNCSPYQISSNTNGCYGVCSSGQVVCDQGQKQCIHPAQTSTEVCNGLDDNCDGRIDEGFNLQTDPNNCGACNKVCAPPNVGTAGCVAGACTIVTCAAGYADLDHNPANGCEYHCPVFPVQSETCNGKDDDCNGLVDDNPVDVGGNCDNNCPAPAPCVAQGTCSYPTSTCTGTCCGVCTEGKQVCVSGQKVCQGGGGVQLEVCDGKDNNCDGQIDEGFNLLTDPLNCGSCGHTCNPPNAVASCVNGTCGVASCKPGYANLDGNMVNGCEYQCPVYPTTTESCNGLDDNCDGQIDNGLTTPTNTCLQTSICAGSHPVCNGTAGWQCNYKQVNPNIEVDTNGNVAVVEALCDGFDGNCNGQVDETWQLKGTTCTNGKGVCAGTGQWSCKADKTGIECPATPDLTKAVDELCDGLDNNCDGNVDERVPTSPGTCYNGTQHTCLGYTDNMVSLSGSLWIYTYEASHPGATGSDFGIKTNRSCSVSGVLPWTTVNYNDAAAACAAVKDSTGAAMHVCTKAEWQLACEAGSAANPVWAYASSPTVFNGTTCNGYEQNLLQPWVTGHGASCYANDTNGHVFDLSGNVAEWTSTSQTVLGNVYYSVMGGGYYSVNVATSCNFDFVLEQAGYSFADLGFRCCATHAP